MKFSKVTLFVALALVVQAIVAVAALADTAILCP